MGCQGCGKEGELVSGVCRNRRRTEPLPKLQCLRSASRKSPAALETLETLEATRPRKLRENFVLWRMRMLDRAGKGCFASLNVLRRDVDPSGPSVSLRTARRAISALRHRGEILFLGETAEGKNIYLRPGQSYRTNEIPLCSARSMLRWDNSAARKLLSGAVSIDEPRLIDGVAVSARLSQEFSEATLREAIALLMRTYGSSFERGKNGVRSLPAAIRWAARVVSRKARRVPAKDLPTPPREVAKEIPPEAKAMIAALLGRCAADVAEVPSPQTPQFSPQTSAPLRASPPFMTLLDRFLAEEQAGVSQKTLEYRRYKALALRRHLPEHLTLDELHTKTLSQYVVARCKSAKLQTIKKEVILALQVAEWAGAKPKEDPKLRKLLRRITRKASRKPLPLTRGDFSALRAALPEDRRDFLDLAIFTGARASELASLRAEDCDFSARTIRIRGTKTEGSDRTIPAHPRVLEIARRKHGLLLEPWHNKWRDLRIASKKAGIQPRAVLDFRHTFATWLKLEGVDSFVVGKLLGHTSSRLVESTYAHLDLNSMRQAVSVLPDQS